MSDDTEGKGFQVNDRRIKFDENGAGTASSDTANDGAATSSTAPGSTSSGGSKTVEGPGWKMEHQDEKKPADQLPPMDFTHFCLSLAGSALINLGDAASPESGKTEADLNMARQTIDILAMLEAKTQGNLTEDESRLLSTVLYDLRMRFLSKSRP